MGQAGGVILKVNFDSEEEVYFRFPKSCLDILYKINDHRYEITPDQCYRTDLGVISSKPTVLSLTCDEVKFVRSVRDFCHTFVVQDDEESCAVDNGADPDLKFERLAHKPHFVNSRIVISL